MNTYTHLGLDDAKDEMIRLEELEQARKEIDKTNGEKPMKQIMFKAIWKNEPSWHFHEYSSLNTSLWRGVFFTASYLVNTHKSLSIDKALSEQVY